MPVRLFTQSLLRWPEPAEVFKAVTAWAAAQSLQQPGFERLGVYGSYGRGDAGVGSDLDLVLIDRSATGTASERFRQWPFEELPLSCDALILTPPEWEQLILSCRPGSAEKPGTAAMALALQRDCRWLWIRDLPASGEPHD
jgi:hypothetical protein